MTTQTTDIKQCPYCAETIKAAAIVCRYCGRDLTQPDLRGEHAARRQNDPYASSSRATVVVCPDCGKDDLLARVSAIVSQGTRSTDGFMPVSTVSSFNGSIATSVTSAPFSSTSKTDLASILEPPKAPEYDRHFVRGVAILVFCGLVAATLLVGSVLTIVGSPGWWLSAVDRAGNIVHLPEAQILGGGLLVAAVVLLVIRQIWRIRDAAECEREMPRWERAMERWEQLYYCRRDDVVFIPGEGAPVLADDIDELIYG